jgi:RNA-binding protein
MKSSERQALKSQAHSLKPVVIIGSNRLTESVLEEIDRSLLTHELIKVKVSGLEKEDRKACGTEIVKTTGCELIQMIGNILVLYRYNPKKHKGR